MHEAQGETMQLAPFRPGGAGRHGEMYHCLLPRSPAGEHLRSQSWHGSGVSGGAELLRPTGGWNFPPDRVLFMSVFRPAV